MFASISVVTYNRRKLSEFCIESIVGNTPADSYELIVVDNGSTDGTVEMLREKKEKGLVDRIILNSENALGLAINEAWTVSYWNADWLITFSNDHFVMEGWFENFCKVVEDLEPDYVFCLLRAATFHQKERKRTERGGFYMERPRLREETERKFEMGAGLAIKREIVGEKKLLFSTRPFFPKAKSPFSLMCGDLIRFGLKKVELGKPCALEQDSEFNSPEYEDYYRKTFGQRAKLNRWERLKKEGYTRFLKEYYKGSGYPVK